MAGIILDAKGQSIKENSLKFNSSRGGQTKSARKIYGNCLISISQPNFNKTQEILIF